ncbi:MAG: VTT domain-containing protein [Planctomycetota bacterium]
MRSLIRVMLPLFAFFTTMMIVARATGLVTPARIQAGLEAAREASPFWAMAVVAGLLTVDLFIFVPTLTVLMLAGYLIGFPLAFVAGATGLYLAGLVGYGLSWKYGEALVRRVVKDETRRREMNDAFRTHGVAMILLSRAAPMLPEMTACLSGMTRMRFGRFLLAWTGSVVPYVLVTTFAGSRSSLDNPLPAIATAIGMAAVFGIAWWLFRKRVLQATPATA